MCELVFCLVLRSKQKEYRPFSHSATAAHERNDGQRGLACLVDKTALAMLGGGVYSSYTMQFIMCANATW